MTTRSGCSALTRSTTCRVNVRAAHRPGVQVGDQRDAQPVELLRQLRRGHLEPGDGRVRRLDRAVGRDPDRDGGDQRRRHPVQPATALAPVVGPPPNEPDADADEPHRHQAEEQVEAGRQERLPDPHGGAHLRRGEPPAPDVEPGEGECGEHDEHHRHGTPHPAGPPPGGDGEAVPDEGEEPGEDPDGDQEEPGAQAASAPGRRGCRRRWPSARWWASSAR